jgi:hypothetical protein
MMPAGCENWPITVTLLAASGKGECLKRAAGGIIMLAKCTRKNRTVLDQLKTFPDRLPSQLRKSRGDVVYQHNAATIFRGKNAIFELTHMVKAASCRPYPEKRSGL